MPRPRSEQPTPAELEILKVLWDRGPATVRQVLDHLPHDPPKAYTTVMSLLNVMHEKGLVERQPHGRAFLYKPAARRDKTLKSMVADIVDRAFEGSASALVAHLLRNTKPSQQELEEIRKLIAEHQRHTTSPSLLGRGKGRGSEHGAL
jgi:BlaI family transcriptional regulator, penicillinase repressor